MTEQTVTAADAEQIMNTVQGHWHTLSEPQQAAWRRGLTGKDVVLAEATLGELINQGGEHPPSWAGFAALYARKNRAAREIAESESRGAPVTDMTRDDPNATTYIRLCQAYCRRITADDDRIWLEALFGPSGPRGHNEFMAVMRPIAEAVDQLPADRPFAERCSTAIGAHT